MKERSPTLRRRPVTRWLRGPRFQPEQNSWVTPTDPKQFPFVLEKDAIFDAPQLVVKAGIVQEAVTPPQEAEPLAPGIPETERAMLLLNVQEN